MPRTLHENATLLHREDLSPDLAIFRVRPDETPPEGTLWFLPGQYAALGLNVEGPPPHSVVRTYSLASDPEDRRWLEFYIRKVDDPHSPESMTHLLWRRPAGSRLYVSPKITGRFTLQHTIGEEDRRRKLLVASGTGLSPFISMVRHAAHMWPNRLHEYAVFHGARVAAELGYRDELTRLLNREGRTRYFPTVSRPHLSPGWGGHTGRVETFFDPDALRKTEANLELEAGGLGPRRAVVFLCGLHGTIAACVRRLVPLGFVPADRRLRALLEGPEGVDASLFYEQYDQTPVVDPEDHETVEALRRALRRHR